MATVAMPSPPPAHRPSEVIVVQIYRMMPLFFHFQKNVVCLRTPSQDIEAKVREPMNLELVLAIRSSNAGSRF